MMQISRERLNLNLIVWGETGPAEERVGAGNMVFSGSSTSCCKYWLLASDKLPDIELHGLGAGTPHAEQEGLASGSSLSGRTPSLTPLGANAVLPQYK